MATKPKFLASMGYHIFLTIVLSARAPSARGELCYESHEETIFYADSTYERISSGYEPVYRARGT